MLTPFICAALSFWALPVQRHLAVVGLRTRRLALNAEPPKDSTSVPAMPGVPSFEQFKKMMQTDVSPEKLSVGEKVQAGISQSWVNPAYWSRQFVQASHISNNVPNASRVVELGKDAKNLYYLNAPAACTLIVPPSNAKIEEGPIREAAAKLNVPFTLWTGKPLDEIPLRPGAFDAALCFDMLDGAPEQAAAGAIALLSSSLTPNGRLLFLERATVGMPALARTYGGLNVQFDTEGGFDVGIGTKPGVGKPGGAKRKVAAAAAAAQQQQSEQARAAMAAKGGFGAVVGTREVSKKAKAAEKEARAAEKEAREAHKEAE